MRGAERHLLSLRKEFINGSVQYHLTNSLKGYEFFGPNFGTVKDIKVKFVLILLCNSLDSECPFSGASILNGFVKIFTVKV